MGLIQTAFITFSLLLPTVLFASVSDSLWDQLHEIQNSVNKINQPSNSNGLLIQSLITGCLILLGSCLTVIVNLFISLRQTRASTISHFRIKWIGELRDAYSSFYVSFNIVCLKIWKRQYNANNSASSDQDWHDHIFYKAKIGLLLNRTDDPKAKDIHHTKFWNGLAEYYDACISYHSNSNGPNGTRKESREIEEALRMQREELEKILREKIFKEEWEKVKNFK